MDNYLEYLTLTSLSGWHAMWFYIGNHQPGLPKRIDVPLKYESYWVEDLLVAKLVKRIHTLKAKGVTGVSVSYSFEHRIQPL